MARLHLERVRAHRAGHCRRPHALAGERRRVAARQGDGTGEQAVQQCQERNVRTQPVFKKSQKDVETNSKELIKLAKEAKDLNKDAIKKAKDVAEPEKKWLEYIGEFIKSTENLEKIVAQPNAKFSGRQERVERDQQGLHRLPQRFPS